MTILALVLMSVVLAFATLVQMLYLESMRLRSKETPALDYFKDVLADRIGWKVELGALTFSLWKHLLTATLGVMLALLSIGGGVTALGVLEAVGLTWLVVLAATYLVPQIVYRRSACQWLSPLVPLMKLMGLIVRPLTLLMSFLQSLFELTQPQQPHSENGNGDKDKEIEALIEAGTEEGLIEEGDRKLIQAVVEFGDKTVREVMTPRPDIVAIGMEATLEDLRALVIHEQFSRIPAFEESLDNIRGFVHVRDLFEIDSQKLTGRRVKEIMRPIRLVPETKAVRDLFEEMREKGAHMVVVVDEYGSTAGIATLEDLMEEVFGEIRDEHEPAHDIERDSGGAILVAGSFDVDHLETLLGFRPEAETEATTIAGLVTEWMGRVPRVGEVVERDGIRIEVLDGNERRVDRVRVLRIGEARTETEEERIPERSPADG